MSTWSGTNRAMGSVIAGGQTLSLLLTLIATPVIFSWLDDLAHSRLAGFLGAILRWPMAAMDRLVSRKRPEQPPVVPTTGEPAPGDTGVRRIRSGT